MDLTRDSVSHLATFLHKLLSVLNWYNVRRDERLLFAWMGSPPLCGLMGMGRIWLFHTHPEDQLDMYKDNICGN